MDETTEKKVEGDISNASQTNLEVETLMDKGEISKGPVKKIGRCFYISEDDVEETATIKTEEGYVVHYYIELLEDKSITLEVVGEDGEPTGKLMDRIPMTDFLKTFKACSQHICHLLPKTVEEISKKMAENRVEMGEKHLEEGDLEGAEDKFNRALKFDEESVRATLGLGKTKMEQKKVDEAMAIFNTLSKENAIYEKAITIDPTDHALLFNLARAYGVQGLALEGKDNEKARENINVAIGKLREALTIKSDFPEAKKFLRQMLLAEEKIFSSLIGSDDSGLGEENQSAA